MLDLRVMERGYSYKDLTVMWSGSEGVPAEQALTSTTVHLRSGQALTRTGVIS